MKLSDSAMLGLTMLVLCSVAISACGSSSRASRTPKVPGLSGGQAARKRWTPPPVVARPIVEQPGAVAVGTVVRTAALSSRVFADGVHGYALAFIDSETYPAATVDSGKTWRVDGPVFHIPAAQGAVAVGAMGVASAGTAFAWGGVIPNTVVDVTTDGGKHWWQSFLPGSVLFVGQGGPGELLANVYGRVTMDGTTHTGLWAYRTTTGRRWTYAYHLS